MSILSNGLPPSEVRTGDQVNSTGKRILHVLAVVAIALAGALVFTARVRPATMDYISYWSAGKLLVHRADPYSPAGVLALEKPFGFMPTVPLIMRNPPWALFLTAPLGFTSIRIGLFLWTLAVGGCIVTSVQVLNPGSRDNPLALLFAPAIACIGAGQSSAFLLLGFVLFLHLHRTHPFLSGASLLFLAIKPHLFLVFWAVLLADCIYRRNFLIIAGLLAGLAAATTFSMGIDAHIWPQYLAMLRASALDRESFPTISMLFRLLINARADWLLFLPSVFAVLWGLWYYIRKRKVWSWNTHGMLLMLITVLASPYGWFTDEIVLLPSVIFALRLPEKRKYSGWILLSINCAAALIYTAAGASLESPFLLWTPIAWLAWFLYATNGVRPPSTIPQVEMKGQEIM
jgi:hypothetical protein